MTTTDLRQFDATVHKTNQWISDLLAELDWQDRQGAYGALRSVLHALRDRLSIQEASDLAAQLPMLVRGFYYEGWQPSKAPVRSRTSSEFLEHVRGGIADEDWVDVEQITRAVFRVLTKHVSPGEIEDVRRCLPEDIRTLWE